MSDIRLAFKSHLGGYPPGYNNNPHDWETITIPLVDRSGVLIPGNGRQSTYFYHGRYFVGYLMVGYIVGVLFGGFYAYAYVYISSLFYLLPFLHSSLVVLWIYAQSLAMRIRGRFRVVISRTG